MKCSNCGKEIAGNSLFCEFCGTKVRQLKNVRSAPDVSASTASADAPKPTKNGCRPLAPLIVGGFILFVVVMVLLVTSEYQNYMKKEAGQSGNMIFESADTVVADSTKSRTIDMPAKVKFKKTEQKAETKPETTQETTPTTSMDLKWARVQGPVKTISEKETNSNESYTIMMRFDSNGNYIEEPDDDETLPHKIVRDASGRIYREIDEEWGCETFTHQWRTTYKYNKEGFVCSKIYESNYVDLGWVDETQTYNYALNSKGWIVSSKSEWKDDNGIIQNENATYTYSDIDRHGNWQKCVIKRTAWWTGKGKSTTTERISRKITYWK